MIGWLVVAYGDAELEWLCEDKAEAFAILREQLDHVDNVSIGREELVSKDHFRDEQERYARRRTELEDEEYFERMDGAA